MKKAAEEVIAEVMPEEKEAKEPSVVSPQIEKEIDEKQKKPIEKKGKSDSRKLKTGS